GELGLEEHAGRPATGVDASPERSEFKEAARPPVVLETVGRRSLVPSPPVLVVVRFTPRAIPETRYLARSRDDPSNKGAVVRGFYSGIGVPKEAPSERRVVRVTFPRKRDVSSA